MPRTSSAAWQAETARLAGAYPVRFLMADFGPDAGVVRLYDGVADRSWNGVDWLARGEFVSALGGRESADRRRDGLSVRAAGRNADGSRQLRLDAMSARTGGEVVLYLGYLESDGDLVASPVALFAGEVASVVVEGRPDGGAEVVVEAEREVFDLDRSQRYRMTAASQAAIDPTDKGFEFQANIGDRRVGFGSRFFNQVKED
jgi:hypothetical protein